MNDDRNECTLYSSLRSTLGPLFLLLASPTFALVIWYTCIYLGGSLEALWHRGMREGFFRLLGDVWMPNLLGSSTAWLMIASFLALQLILMRVMPGKVFYGPVTPMGNTPVYKANGVPAFVVTLFTWWLCAYPLDLFSPGIVYDNFGELLGALNLLSFVLCLALYFKGVYFPSTTDSGKTGNFIFDFYWGTELYPQVLGWDLKLLINCRCGMMAWAIIILSLAAKQQIVYGLSDSMIVAVSLQLIYIFKFFWWETGYLRSLDVMHDRAGFYICWGLLVWVPAVYTSPILYLVDHPNLLGFPLAALIFACGAACILINYLADRQRQVVRATEGGCRIWGKSPEYSIVSYTTTDGKTKQNLLLLSGWWGISRHFHYIPEILAAFFWSVPALFDNFLPYFYVVFLTVLLFDRAVRDDERCAKKYGEGWKNHCRRVKYKIIPFVY